MPRRIIELAGTHTLLLGLLCWGATMAALQMWPASRWLEVRSVRIADARVGQPIVMSVDRTIHRITDAAWSVSVKSLTSGKHSAVCSHDAFTRYRPGALLPIPVTLGWWTHGRCEALPPGQYVVDTIWRIKTPLLLGEKVVVVTSNIFEVVQ